MSAFLRRVTGFRLNNIRTFADSLITVSQHEIQRLVGSCRLLKMAEHIRILFISVENGASDTGFIRLEVGNCDNRDENLGIAHLLEHVVVRSWPGFNAYTATTYDEYTIYKLKGSDFWEDFETFSKHLFSSDSDILKRDNVIQTEIRRVDAEHHGKRTVSTWNRMHQIYYSNEISMEKFGAGNASLLNHVTHVELAEVLKLYGERPMLVCIYSSLSLDDIEKKFKENFWIYRHYTAEQAQRTPRDAREVRQLKKTNNLFVVQSVYEFLQLRMLFPFGKTFSSSERNTLRIIGSLTNEREYFNLEDFLMNMSIATSCKYELFSFGLEIVVDLICPIKRLDIQRVIATILQYYQCLYDGSGVKDVDEICELKAQSNLKNLKEFISNGLFLDKFDEQEINDDFVLSDLVKCEPAKELLSQEILQNKNLVYSIVAQEPADVLTEFNGNDLVVQTEKHFATQYYSVPHDLDVDGVEGWLEESDIVNIGLNIKCPTYETFLVNDSQMLVYQHLFAAESEVLSKCVRRSCKVFFPGDYEYHTKVGKKVKSLKETAHVLNFSHERGDAETFKFAKEYKRRSLSLQLIDSGTLAKSLLTVAIRNSNGSSAAPIEPIPLIYWQMLYIDYMEYSNYLNHFDKFGSISEDDKKKIKKIHPKCDFFIKSINKNEQITVTLNFLSIDKSMDGYKCILSHMLGTTTLQIKAILGAYFVYCSTININGVNGILLETRTVESKMQSAQVVRGVLQQVAAAAMDKAESVYCVQVQGHAECTPEREEKFDKQFLHWFDEHEKQFANIRNPCTVEGEDEGPLTKTPRKT